MVFPSLFTDFVGAVHVAEKSRILDQQMQATSVAMGSMDEAQVSGILAMALAQVKRQNSAETQKKNRSFEDILHAALIDHIHRLNQQIANMEDTFKARFGDSWREEIALRILSENDIPRQQSGETISQYRERLEAVLVDELLNDDGTVKAVYQDHESLREYAQWAQKIYNRDAAQVIANDLTSPGISLAQTQELLDRLKQEANSEKNIYTARALDGHETEKQAVMAVESANKVEATQDNQNANAGGFLNLTNV